MKKKIIIYTLIALLVLLVVALVIFKIKNGKLPILEKNNPERKADVTYSLTTKEMNGVKFLVTTETLEGKPDVIKIKPEGYTKNSNPQTVNIKGGEIRKVEISDLDNDSFPELFIYVYAKGNAKNYGYPLIYSSNKKWSMGDVEVLETDPYAVDADAKYDGEDEFKIVDRKFVHTHKLNNGKKRQTIYEMDSETKPKQLKPIDIRDI
ncbi:hypothetical protein CSB11_01185 [Candidatus Campbellbacteria bacterium]|nr:MAG: hypothetical protein CSB11_01185 [Candidatus Campbellbacteria bacterium]